MSQEEFAHGADINRFVFGRLERVGLAATVELLEKLSAVLDHDLAAVFGCD